MIYFVLTIFGAIALRGHLRDVNYYNWKLTSVGVLALLFLIGALLCAAFFSYGAGIAAPNSAGQVFGTLVGLIGGMGCVLGLLCNTVAAADPLWEKREQ